MTPEQQRLAAPLDVRQPDERFSGPAYHYLHAADALPPSAAMDPDDPLCVVKLFSVDLGWTFYVAGFEDRGDGRVVLWGWCEWLESEWGTIFLDEVLGMRGALGLAVERDLHWKPRRLSELVRAAS